MIADSHVHLHLINYNKLRSTLSATIRSAIRDRVEYQLCVSTNIYQHKEIIYICDRYQNIYGSVGIHPNEQYNENEYLNTERLIRLSNHKKIKAIGETGLDYLGNNIQRKIQIKRFEHHIEASLASNLPIIIHSRESKRDILDIIKYYSRYDLIGVLHCFSDDLLTAKKLLDFGFFISFSGTVTFHKNYLLKEVVKNIPLEKMMVETDAPYLSPHPYRGRINEPKYVSRVVEEISNIKQVRYEEVSKKTNENFKKLFSID